MVQTIRQELLSEQLAGLRQTIETQRIGRVAVAGEDEASIAGELGIEVSSHASHEEILAQAALAGVAALIPIQKNGLMVPHDGSPTQHTLQKVHESSSRTLKALRLPGENGIDLLALVQGVQI